MQRPYIVNVQLQLVVEADNPGVAVTRIIEELNKAIALSPSPIIKAGLLSGASYELTHKH